MTGPSIQDRTTEFSAILGHAQRRLGTSKVGSQRQALLTDAQRRQANGSPTGAQNEKRARSEFARKAADIGRGITSTTAKLQRLAECECSQQGRNSRIDLTLSISGQAKNPF
jgi:syntaxin 5